MTARSTHEKIRPPSSQVTAAICRGTYQQQIKILLQWTWFPQDTTPSRFPKQRRAITHLSTFVTSLTKRATYFVPKCGHSEERYRETPVELCRLARKKTFYRRTCRKKESERKKITKETKMENGVWTPLLCHKCSSCHALYPQKSITIYCLYWDAYYFFTTLCSYFSLFVTLCWMWQFKDLRLWSIKHILLYTSKGNCKEWRNLTSEKAPCYL